MTPAVWKRIGHIERVSDGRLKVCVTSFGKEHTGYVALVGIRRLTQPGSMPADIIKTKVEPDGVEVTEMVGKIFRSRSGRGVIVTMPALNGEASGSWGGLRDLIGGIRERLALSVLKEEKPFRAGEQAPVKAAVNGSLYDGLERRF